MDGKIICRFTQPQNKPYAFSTKIVIGYLQLILARNLLLSLLFKEEIFVKSARVKLSVEIVKKIGHSLFDLQVFLRESTFVAFDKSAFITSCATQSDKLFRKVIAMHGFLAACTSWARQHAKTTAFAANGSHSIGILKEIRKSLKSSNLKTKSHLTLKGRRICLNSPHSFIFSMASAS